MKSFFGQTADECWRSAARGVLAEGCVVPGRGGPAQELLHTAMTIADPRQRWVISRSPAINPAFAIVESFWILCGRDDSALVNFWNPLLPTFAGSGPRYSGAYGKRLRTRFGVDQVARSLDALEANPESRQVTMQIWDAATDLPTRLGAPASEDIPCNLVSSLKVRDGKLHWLQTMRSNDLMRGTPYNIVQFTLLQEFMAGCLGLVPGEYVQVADSLHLYATDQQAFEVREVDQIPHSDFTFALPRLEAEKHLQATIHSLDVLASPYLTRDDFRSICSADLPPSYLSLLSIPAADSARRRGWTDLQEAASEACRDPLLRLAWDSWRLRVRSSLPQAAE